LDDSVKDLPPTLQRELSSDVNAWLCKGVVCSPSVNDLQALLNSL
jgi:uncharacterized protein YyaL (SSP411 family)